MIDVGFLLYVVRITNPVPQFYLMEGPKNIMIGHCMYLQQMSAIGSILAWLVTHISLNHLNFD